MQLQLIPRGILSRQQLQQPQSWPDLLWPTAEAPRPREAQRMPSPARGGPRWVRALTGACRVPPLVRDRLLRRESSAEARVLCGVVAV